MAKGKNVQKTDKKQAEKNLKEKRADKKAKTVTILVNKKALYTIVQSFFNL